MKLLDRYIFSIYGSAFGLVTMTFVALFTAMDLSSRIARILSLKNINTMSFLLNYYLVRLPMFLHLVLPAVSLFAAMFTVIQLQKTNELLPMITSGVSLRRLCFIFVAGALFCAVLMAVLDEYVLPALMGEIRESDDILISDKPQKNQVYPAEKVVWIVDEYDRVKKQMKGVTFTRYRGDGRREVVIRAQTATWDPGQSHWVLRTGTSQPFDAEGAPRIVRPDGKLPQPLLVPIPEANDPPTFRIPLMRCVVSLPPLKKTFFAYIPPVMSLDAR